jgi:hypothetical protein
MTISAPGAGVLGGMARPAGPAEGGLLAPVMAKCTRSLYRSAMPVAEDTPAIVAERYKYILQQIHTVNENVYRFPETAGRTSATG